MWGMIATWRMALEGVTKGSNLLEKGESSSVAVEIAVKEVEDYPFYKSVGYGGLPNENCELELDAAFMDGGTYSIGAVAGIMDYKNPISIAKKLSEDRFNIFLISSGAESYAHKNGFERKNMLTERAKKLWELRKKEIQEKNLSPYDGHDTVCVIGLDKNKELTVGTSTSGLFMKKKGRVGDSPIPGSGFYADSDTGAAAATGLGEDIMKGCLSYEVVRRMAEGLHPMEAAQGAINSLVEKLENKRGKAGAMSVVAMNNRGEWGIGTNVEFSFVVSLQGKSPKVYLAQPGKIHKEGVLIEEVSKEWMEAYQQRITKPLEEM